MKKSGIISVIVLFLICTLVAGIYLNFDIEKMKKDIDSRYSQIIVDDQERIIGAYLNSEEQWQIKGESKIPERLKLAVISYEDRDFMSHSGINYFAILRAVKTNIITKKRV